MLVLYRFFFGIGGCIDFGRFEGLGLIWGGFGGSKSVSLGIDLWMSFQERPKSSEEHPKTAKSRPRAAPERSRAAEERSRVAK